MADTAITWTSTNDVFNWDGTSTSSFVGGAGYDKVNVSVSTTALSLGSNLNSIEQVTLNASALTSTQTLAVTVADAAFQSSLDRAFILGKQLGGGGIQGSDAQYAQLGNSWLQHGCQRFDDRSCRQHQQRLRVC